MMGDSLEETYRLEALSSLAGAALRPQTSVECHCGEHLEERLTAIEAAVGSSSSGDPPASWAYYAAGVITGFALGRIRR